MAKPKWIVFDMGGVLVDWRPSIGVVGDRLGVSSESLFNFLSKYIVDLELGKMEEIDFWEKVVKEFNSKISGEDIKESWLFAQPKISETWALVNKLRGKYDLSICTNTWSGKVDRQLVRLPEFKIFSEIIDSSVEKVRKPHKEMYESVESKLEAKGEKLYFIDDSMENIEGARAVGWQTFYFDRSKETEKLVEEIESILL